MKVQKHILFATGLLMLALGFAVNCAKKDDNGPGDCPQGQILIYSEAQGHRCEPISFNGAPGAYGGYGYNPYQQYNPYGQQQQQPQQTPTQSGVRTPPNGGVCGATDQRMMGWETPSSITYICYKGRAPGGGAVPRSADGGEACTVGLNSTFNNPYQQQYGYGQQQPQVQQYVQSQGVACLPGAFCQSVQTAQPTSGQQANPYQYPQMGGMGGTINGTCVKTGWRG